MALQKEIELENGVTLNYHRVVSVNSITNISTTIEIASYVNEAKRLEEKEYQTLQMKQDRTQEEEEQLEQGINVYIETEYIDLPYTKDMNVDSAYKYLITLDKYKGSKKV
jgi:hypothetical protein